jgi:hypothetical protein
MRTTAILAVLAAVSLSAGQKPQTFTGTITDGMCAQADHSRMRMGSTDAECTNACVSSHGAPYVLYTGKNSYTLATKQPPDKLAGQKVTVVGVLNAKTQTIQVESIAAAK